MTEYNEGDLVRVEKGEVLHQARLVRSDLWGDATRLFLPGFLAGKYVELIAEEGFTVTVIEKAKPKVELPTESGFYLSRDAKLWTLEVNGYWRDDYDYTRRPDEAEARAPFTRLEPRAVTAKAVLDRFVAVYQSTLRTTMQDVDTVRAEFGVTS